MKSWQLLLRELGTWVTGVGLVVSQIWAHPPSELLVGAGIVLIAPGVYPHIKGLLPGSTGGPSSESARPPASSPRGGDDEEAG